MKKWGGYLFFFGVGSIVLYFLHLQFILLAWIDMWGMTVGWTIRSGLAVVGAAMWLLGREPESEAASS